MANRIKVPNERCYYRQRSAGKDILLCWLPPEEYAAAFSNPDVFAYHRKYHPRGIEFEIADPVSVPQSKDIQETFSARGHSAHPARQSALRARNEFIAEQSEGNAARLPEAFVALDELGRIPSGRIAGKSLESAAVMLQANRASGEGMVRTHSKDIAPETSESAVEQLRNFAELRQPEMSDGDDPHAVMDRLCRQPRRNEPS